MRQEPKANRHLMARYRDDPIEVPVVVIEEMFPVPVATAGGDEQKLRGIPVIGGAAGAIRGTVPHAIRDIA